MSGSTTSTSNALVTTGSSQTVGYMAVFLAMQEGLSATQDFVNSLTELGTQVMQTENTWATYYNDFMAGPLNKQINTDAGNSGNPGYIQRDTAELSTVNSQLSQSNSFWGGLSQSVQQSGSNASNSISVVYQLLQQGILSMLTTLAQSWKN